MTASLSSARFYLKLPLVLRRCAEKVNARLDRLNGFGGKEFSRPGQFILSGNEAELARAGGLSGSHDRVNRRAGARQGRGRRPRFEPMMKEERGKKVAGAVDCNRQLGRAQSPEARFVSGHRVESAGGR